MDVNKGGRPKKAIDFNLFEELCNIQCTKDEICSVLHCDEKTLTKYCKEQYDKGFSDIYKKLSENGTSSLRRLQWTSAKTGNTTMQIWLGKQYLGQRDNKDIQLKDLRPIEILNDLPND